MPLETRSKHSREASLDEALKETFPASDPVSTGNPSTGSRTPEPAPRQEAFDRRVHEQAEKLWREAGCPESGPEAFLYEAQILVTIEEEPKPRQHRKSPS